RTISNEEDLELERQLKLRLNNIKTVKTEVGDVYDCVDIRKQPSLDHSSLRNHEIQMSSSRPKRKTSETSSVSTHSRVAQKDLITVDCPQGTVPIRRIGKEDLLRAKSFTESYASNIHPMTKETPGEHYAIVRSKNNERVEGVAAEISLHSLDDVGASQSSSAQVWIDKRVGNDYASLQPYLQLLWMHYVSFEDRKTSNWWLLINEHVQVGYWPAGLLGNSLNDGASYVAWGGLAQGPANDASPKMGAGHFGNFDYYEDAHFTQLQIVNTTFFWVNPKEDVVEQFVDNENCYYVNYNGFRKGKGHTFLYGGPGGNCGL
ncbi:hypothetical protein IFM89_018699, partial [Coptis chinensis]